jgi:hypothetical protein
MQERNVNRFQDIFGDYTLGTFLGEKIGRNKLRTLCLEYSKCLIENKLVPKHPPIIIC